MEKTSIDYGKGLTWYFKDPKLAQVLLHFSLLLLSCIIILPIFYVGPLLTGYTIAVIRNIQNGKFELPEIDPSIQWKEGVLLVLVSMVLSFGVSIFTSGGSFLSAFVGQSNEDLMVIFAVLQLFLSLIGMVLGLILGVFQALMTIIYAKTGNWESLLVFDNYKKLFAQNGWTILLAMVLVYVVSSTVAGIGFMLCCIGILPAAVISMMITSGIYGQFDTTGVES